MRKDEIEKRLKEIKTENIIWLIYIIIIILSYYSNYFEKKYFLYNDLNSKKKYQEILVFIFLVLIVVYFYFLSDSYQSLKDIDFDNITQKDMLIILSFIASLLIFISGIIFLYVAIKDDDLNVELAFN